MATTEIFANKIFERDFDKCCVALEKITGRQLYVKDYHIFLTTFPRGPYNAEKGYIWMGIFNNIKRYPGSFLHEVLHFQFIHGRKNTAPTNTLSENQFEYFKEAMTVILNDSCPELLFTPDGGYPMHQEFRKEILEEWQKHRDFESLVS